MRAWSSGVRRGVRLVAAVTVALWAPVAASTQAASASSQSAQTPRVLVTTVDDAITPVVADHLETGLRRAERGNFAAFVVRLDTPGGLETSMRDIIQDFLAARVPVLVYVGPQGARAASAGALVTFAAHVAAMAPGTTIGASTPVSLEGGGDVERKVVNDAAAFAESIARLRNRNVDFARATVTEGRSVPSTEAVDIKAVDYLASSLADALDQADGRTVDLGETGLRATLRTADADTVEHDMGFLRRMQQRLADPNLAYLFLSIGTLALIYELASPGMGMGGITGAILILLALFALSVLPVNTVGLLLVGLAAALFVVEVVVPGVGVAAVGGSICLVLGGIFLFEETPGIEVSLALVVPTAVLVGAGTVLAGRLALRSQRSPSSLGASSLVGRVVEVGRVTEGGARGQALLDGAWWNVRTSGRHELQPGVRVRVQAVEGLDLVGEPVGDDHDAEQKGVSP